MQNEQTLIDLGFTVLDSLYNKETDNKWYILKLSDKTYVAYVNYWERPQYVSLGMIINTLNINRIIVDRWRQCYFDGSVKSYII